MAGLVAGVQYGLSSHIHFHENKSFIFVKLTDSAQRAIEEYLRNRNKTNQSPTIQFLGTEGQLCFPSGKSKHGNFTFSLSSNQDVEGPQGGFECVQQLGPKNLESLGTMPCKMRIHANDDVYETTRHRMHVAEENNKNKCTRVIKANEPIGRKIKVKGSVKNIQLLTHPSSNFSPRSRELSSLPASSGQLSKPSSPIKLNINTVIGKTQPDIQKKSLDIIRKPLKERLIHLLALRPFKRPELYDRINREGVREKEKNIIATILKQIAFMRDNTYHLNRCLWNDVQENWPFYSDQEKAILKRRKPQNLTPPGSSDGSSSGSGQSPNSIHPGSPSSFIAPLLEACSSKRPGYYQGNDGLPTKRQRISHFRKPEFISSDKKQLNAINSWEHRQRQGNNQLSLEQQENTENSDIQSDLTLTNEQNRNNGSTSIDLNPSNNDSVFMMKIDHEIIHLQERDPICDEQYEESIPNVKNTENINEEEFSSISPIEISVNNIESKFTLAKLFKEKDKQDDRNYNFELKHNADDLIDSKSVLKIDALDDAKNHFEKYTQLSFSQNSDNLSSYPATEISYDPDCSNFLISFTTINNSEQRSEYKAAFNTYYKEYQKLYAQVVKISEQFSHLEEELRKKLDCGNMEGYEAIKRRIIQEYAIKKNVNSRFYYLHEKLGHIKKLVSEYDTQLCIGSTPNNIRSHMLNNRSIHDDVLHYLEQKPRSSK